jgi:hypothetical protein
MQSQQEALRQKRPSQFESKWFRFRSIKRQTRPATFFSSFDIRHFVKVITLAE